MELSFSVFHIYSIDSTRQSEHILIMANTAESSVENPGYWPELFLVWPSCIFSQALQFKQLNEIYVNL